MKHTTGPWKIERDSRGTRRIYAEKIEVARVLSSPKMVNLEVTANFKIIAAAPELLAALEAIILDAGKTRMSNLDADLPQDAALIAARAAIAKAKDLI